VRGFHGGKDIPARFSGWDGYSCLVSRLGNIFLRGCQVRTGVLASFPRWDMFLRRFYDWNDISLGYLDGTAAPARFPVWERYTREVFRMGWIFQLRFQNGTYSVKFRERGTFLRGLDGADIPASFP